MAKNYNVAEILSNKDDYMEKLTKHVDGIREVVPYLKLIIFIQELSKEILSNKNEFVESLDEKFGLSNFEASSCNSCWVTNAITNEAINFIDNLDMNIFESSQDNDVQGFLNEVMNFDEDINEF